MYKIRNQRIRFTDPAISMLPMTTTQLLVSANPREFRACNIRLWQRKRASYL